MNLPFSWETIQSLAFQSKWSKSLCLNVVITDAMSNFTPFRKTLSMSRSKRLRSLDGKSFLHFVNLYRYIHRFIWFLLHWVKFQILSRNYTKLLFFFLLINMKNFYWWKMLFYDSARSLVHVCSAHQNIARRLKFTQNVIWPFPEISKKVVDKSPF